ncbi:LysM peptidoglycan-binding domain-containing protein [Ectobacillus panaciterrae]|uniref:LysM peptidoglycan-binding domain-containing protein n=1 Tax=Ectobacillus panaciterrae TaxID=363872 RepID=UPI00041C1237|nr:LysM peptidoglycan-binding domain-containing protein [Ectobacillus panaciterrae]
MKMSSIQTEIEEEEQLELPPRSETHKERERKESKIKIKHWFVRLLVVLFILLPVAVYFVTDRYLEEKKRAEQHRRFESKQFEEIIFAAKRKLAKGQKQQTDAYVSHEVQDGETLRKIADIYSLGSGGEELLRKYNKMGDKDITPGQILKIPATSSIKK